MDLLPWPALTFPEVQKLVETVSSAIHLEFDDGRCSRGAPHCWNNSPKGRFLTAARAIKAGEIFLAEPPLFYGSTDGAQSRQAYVEEFLALMDVDNSDDEPDDDTFHPQSPLADCLAGIILAKRQALRLEDCAEGQQAKLRMQQLSTLCRVDVPEAVPGGVAKDLFDALRPELRKTTSEEEIQGFLLALCSNRFGGADSRLDLMFAGSMFEHSCLPNCFVGTWRCKEHKQARAYRALTDISEGEALSIDYLLMPDSYLPRIGRAELLGQWGFVCGCARCTSLPELTRCFICRRCGVAELCPREPSTEAGFACQACGEVPDEAYAASCMERETAECGEEPDETDSLQPLGRLHHASVARAWVRVSRGPGDGTNDLHTYRADIQLLVDAVSRLYGNPRHPHLLDFYHLLAELEPGDLAAQRHFLELERGVLRHYYPEEAIKQDDEIMRLVQGRGPLSAVEADLEASTGATGIDFTCFHGTELDTMD